MTWLGAACAAMATDDMQFVHMITQSAWLGVTMQFIMQPCMHMQGQRHRHSTICRCPAADTAAGAARAAFPREARAGLGLAPRKGLTA